MSRPAATQLAPGLHRLGDHIVNFYLIEEPDGFVLVDSGVPAHLPLLRERLAELGGRPIPGTADDFGRTIAAETAKWAKVVKVSGAKVD